MKAIAFSPAHITGFFSPVYDNHGNKIGSKGAGISLTLGSYAIVERAEKTRISKKAETALKVVKKFGGKYNVKIKNELPISQGFGISGSSSLATGMAICHIEKISYEMALKYAHMAEIECRTGLGDVISSFHGGMECRIDRGKIKKWRVDKKIIILVAGKGIKTKSVLNGNMERISDVGEDCLNEFLRKPDFENLLYQARRFSEESGILSAKMLRVLSRLNKISPAAACMIGNSFFAEWSREMKKEMKKYGKVYECYVDNEGARIVASLNSFPHIPV